MIHRHKIVNHPQPAALSLLPAGVCHPNLAKSASPLDNIPGSRVFNQQGLEGSESIVIHVFLAHRAEHG